MFVVRNSQIEAMKLPFRQRERGRMLEHLQARGFKAMEDGAHDLAIEDSRGNKTRLLFDERYIPQKIVKPSGLEYAFTFDNDDQLIKLSLPGNETIGFDYQEDLLRAVELNDGRIGLNYDDKGRITEVISQDGKGYKIGYNVSAQVESITNRANETRRYESAIQGSHLVQSMKDSLGRLTQVETDPMGADGDTIRFPDGTEQTSIYDDDLDALVTTLRSGAKVHTYYDGTSPSRVEWEDGNFQDIELQGEEVKSIENPAGTIRFEYDDKGRVLSEEFQGNKTCYVYDEDGNLLEMVYPSGLVVEYRYDADGRLQAMQVGEDVCSYAYGPNDTLSEIRYPNGLTQRRHEKLLGGLQGAQIVDGAGKVLSQQAYHYDQLHRLTRYRNAGSSSPQDVQDWRFEYDAEWRLLRSEEAHSRRAEHFQYDGKGNMVAANGQAMVVGAMDEMRSIGGIPVQYDANGNVRSFVNVRGQGVSLTFNDNNELKFARIGEETWEYWYDGLGRRVSKSNGREAWKFGWGGEKLLTEERRTPEGSTLREYIYGHHAAVPVAFRENGNLFWLHSDVRGAVTQVFDSRGYVVWSAEYNAFGDANILQSSLRQPWRLTGQYFDAETGLHYNTARYYSPHLKSFLSLDKYWFKYEASNYGYAGNDPYNKIDVDGNSPEPLVLVASTVAGIAAGIAVTALIVTIAAPVMATGALAAIAIGVGASVIGSAVGGAVEMVAKQYPTKGNEFCKSCVIENAKNEATSLWNLLPFLKSLKNIKNVVKNAKAFKQSRVNFGKAKSDLAEKSANLEKSQEKLKKAKDTLYEASEKSSKMKKSVKKERKAVNQKAIEKEKSKQNFKDKKKDYNNFKNEEVRGGMKDEGIKKAFNVGDLNENENENENIK